MSYHGYPRATAGMDIWVAISPQNAARVVEVLREFGFAMPQLSPELFLRDDQIVRMGVPPFRLELFTTISGVTFAECYAERIVDTIDDVEVSLINLEKLKANKRASGRLKDLADLQNLP